MQIANFNELDDWMFDHNPYEPKNPLASSKQKKGKAMAVLSIETHWKHSNQKPLEKLAEKISFFQEDFFRTFKSSLLSKATDD